MFGWTVMEASVRLCDCLDNIIGCAVHIVKSRFFPDHAALLDDAVLDSLFGFVSALSTPIVAIFLFVQHVRHKMFVRTNLLTGMCRAQRDMLWSL